MAGRKGFTHESQHNESQEWYTPPPLFEALGLTFDLDPCGAPPPDRDFVPARTRYTLYENGLLRPWKGLVFMNPPYGKDTPHWMRRFFDHGNGLALVFARTDTRWFHEVAPYGMLCFLRGRLRFIRPDGTEAGTPGAGSLLIALGARRRAALVKSGLGFCCAAVKEGRTPEASTVREGQPDDDARLHLYTCSAGGQ